MLTLQAQRGKGGSGMSADYTKIGLPTREDVLAYVEDHREPADGPDGFLWAVLTNDLTSACLRADDVNRHAIWELHAWLWNFAPSPCWGSQEAVCDWLRRGLAGEQHGLSDLARRRLAVGP